MKAFSGRQLALRISGTIIIGFLVLGPLGAEPVMVDTVAGLKAALSGAEPGTEVVIRNGRYRNAVWEVEAFGTEEAPVIVRAETSGKVVSTGQSALRISGEHVEVRGLLFTDGYLPGSSVVEFRSLAGQRPARNCRLTEFAVVDYSPPNRSTRVHWVSFYGRHNRLDHSYFSGQNHNGVTVVVWLSNSDPEPVYHRIDHNHFANRPEGGENGWETIRIGDSDTSLLDSVVTTEDNLFTRCDGEIEIISNKSCSNIFRNNAFVESRGMLTLRHGDRCLVDGNWFFGEDRAATGGIRVIGRDHVVINNYIERTAGRDGAAITVYPGVGGDQPPLNSYFPADRALIAFNTIIGVTGGSYIDIGTRYLQSYQVSSSDIRAIDVLPREVEVSNNVLWSPNGGSYPFVSGQAVDDHYFEGNVLWGANPLGGILPQEGYRNENPGYQNSDGIWQPVDVNPLEGTATGIYPEVTADILGRPRIGETAPGAFHGMLSAGSGNRFPPTAADTGPGWLGPDRDLRVVLWPVRPDFFSGAGEELVDGWLEIDWVGRAYVALFPWIYLEDHGQWTYVEGPGGGLHWFHDTEWGWYSTSRDIYPFVYRHGHGWMYYFGQYNGNRIVVDVAG